MSRHVIHSVLAALLLVFDLAFPAAAQTPVDNLAQNPSFEEDEVILDDPAWEQWATWGSDTSLSSTIEIDDTEFIDGTRSLRIEPAGATNWYFIVLNLPIPMEISQPYTASFWAKAEVPRALTAQMKATDNSVTWGTTAFQLTTEWAEYTFTADAMNGTAKLELLCAGTEIVFWLDFVLVYQGAYVAGIEPSAAGPPVAATGPSPADNANDVLREVILGWTPGQFAQTHDVYLGTNFDDVNGAKRNDPRDVLARMDQQAEAFDPGRLHFEQTYYWRIDEVNGPPDGFIHKGEIWSFTTEPALYLIQGVTATASIPHSSMSGGPEATVDGSGLNASGQHSTADTTMWVGAASPGQSAWIQFDFDRVYKLYAINVWNYNNGYESILGFGVKDVVIEYAAEPNDWMPLGNFQLERAPGSTTYAGQRIDLEGIAAASIRINFNSSQGGGPSYGLSEVQFLHKPVFAREPLPDNGAADVGLNPVLSWRAGREAVSHEVFLGTDEQVVSNRTMLTATTTEASYAVENLALGTTYYWKIDEVNQTESIPAWSSDVWSFTTQPYIVVEDFASYTDDTAAGQAIFQTWLDGYEIAGNGSQVGMDNPPYAEPGNVYSGSQAMLLSYDNGGTATSSAAERTFDDAQNWMQGTAAALVLFFHGDPDNDPDEPMWVRVADASGKSGTVTYGTGPTEDPVNQADAAWHEWSVPLANLGIDPTRVKTLAIGFGGTGPRSTGTMVFDAIRLYPDQTDDQATLAAHWRLDGTAEDSSGYGNDGTLQGGATWVTTGLIGGALSLNGTDAYVDCGDDASLDITDTITLSAWVNMNDANNGQFNPFVIKGDLSYGLKHNSGNQIEFVIYDGGWTTALFPIDESYNEEWHHVAGTYDGLALRLYVDGVLRRLTERHGGIDSTTFNVNIGRNSEIPTRLYNGLIDDVRIYHGALPPARIAPLLTP